MCSIAARRAAQLAGQLAKSQTFRQWQRENPAACPGATERAKQFYRCGKCTGKGDDDRKVSAFVRFRYIPSTNTWEDW